MEVKGGNQWHLEKTVSIGHIITTLTVACSVIVWAMKMDSRIAVLENEQQHERSTRAQMSQDWKEGMSDVKAYLVRIETKLDQKADKHDRPR